MKWRSTIKNIIYIKKSIDARKKPQIYYIYVVDVKVNNEKQVLSKIKDNINTIIVDPPRAGLDPKTKQTILDFKCNKIIFKSYSKNIDICFFKYRN